MVVQKLRAVAHATNNKVKHFQGAGTLARIRASRCLDNSIDFVQEGHDAVNPPKVVCPPIADNLQHVARE